jgi:hypothetical protein
VCVVSGGASFRGSGETVDFIFWRGGGVTMSIAGSMVTSVILTWSCRVPRPIEDSDKRSCCEKNERFSDYRQHTGPALGGL